MHFRKAIVLVLSLCLILTGTAGLAGCGNRRTEVDKGSAVTSDTTGKADAPEAQSAVGSSISQTTSDAAVALPAADDTLQIGKPVFVTEKSRKSINLRYTPISYQAKVPPYTIKNDLSNIENLKQFSSLTAAQRKLLAENGFVVTPTDQQQLFYIYENNEYQKIPSFITSDSILQVYHIFYDYSLRTLEYEKLLSSVEQLTDHMLRKSIAVCGKIQNPQVKAAAMKNAAYFAVAQKSLEKPLPPNMPEMAAAMADTEYAKLKAHKGFEKSSIFPYKLDYSQYVPRGHYTRNHDFERYFVTMMWYGQAPIPLLKEQDGQMKFTDETLQALLMTYTLFLSTNQASDIGLWEKIYDPTTFYVGNSDDLTPYQCADLLVKVYGQEPDLETLADSKKLHQLYMESKKLPEPEIKAKWVASINGVDTPVDKQLRFMGQRYIPDSEILQKLVEPIVRPFPKGLDVMGVLGSSRAYNILMDTYQTGQKWTGYQAEFTKLKKKFAAFSGNKWRSNMYYGWLWVLKSFTEPYGKGYPSFMTNTAWTDKNLATALGSWSELRHDTILYGKQSGAECGGGEDMPVIKSYVEPSVEVYNKLLWLTQYSRQNLSAKGILPEGMADKMNDFENLLQFLINCSVKELRNEELTRDEYNQLLIYGGNLESITSSLAGDGLRWFEITSETDKNMAVVADVHTTPGRYLEEGVGTAAKIHVVVPIGGKLYLTTGAVLDYYEFEYGQRLTDEQWQKMLQEDKQPSSPIWTSSFRTGKEEKSQQ